MPTSPPRATSNTVEVDKPSRSASTRVSQPFGFDVGRHAAEGNETKRSGRAGTPYLVPSPLAATQLTQPIGRGESCALVLCSESQNAFLGRRATAPMRRGRAESRCRMHRHGPDGSGPWHILRHKAYASTQHQLRCVSSMRLRGMRESARPTPARQNSSCRSHRPAGIDTHCSSHTMPSADRNAAAVTSPSAAD